MSFKGHSFSALKCFQFSSTSCVNNFLIAFQQKLMIGKAFYYYFIVVSLYVLIISHCLFLHTDDFIILFQCKKNEQTKSVLLEENLSKNKT